MKVFDYIIKDLNLTRESQGEHSYLFMLLSLLDAEETKLRSANDILDENISIASVFAEAATLAGDAHDATNDLSNSRAALEADYGSLTTASGSLRAVAEVAVGSEDVIAALDAFDVAQAAAETALAAIGVMEGLDSALNALASHTAAEDYDGSIADGASINADLLTLTAAKANYDAAITALGAALSILNAAVTALDDNDTTTAFATVDSSMIDSTTLATAITSLSTYIGQVSEKLALIAGLMAVDTAVKPVFSNPYAEALRRLEPFKDSVAYRTIAALFTPRMDRFVEPPQE